MSRAAAQPHPQAAPAAGGPGARGAGMGVRRFGRVNWLGLYTLTSREVRRFLGVWSQTILAPLMTAGLFLAIFTLAIGPRRGEVMGVPFVEFLAPGILMMTVIQNAFANTSSSLMAAKVQGNIVDTLMPPLSAAELTVGFIAGGIARGLLVAAAVWTVMALTLGVGMAHPLWAFVFVVLGAAFLGGLGVIAGIYAQKFDQMAAITNFIITPLAFLSGTFYALEGLPAAMWWLSHVNPVFYLVDGTRYGIIGVSDSSPWLGLAVASAATALVLLTTWQLFRRGTRMKA